MDRKKSGAMTPQDIRQFEITGIYRACAAGAVVSVDPELAEEMGAFEETALTAEDADDARFDCDPKTGIVLDFD